MPLIEDYHKEAARVVAEDYHKAVARIIGLEARIDELSRAYAVQGLAIEELTAERDHLMEMESARLKIQKALGNGCDEGLWPPGTHWDDAACRCIIHYSHQVISDDYDIDSNS